ncbi:MAG TPA: winged helix-turn-helix domain-containing protein [Pseudorhodoferax sp.]|nr:winged helix-turn-helix domain-containing protein [Pseudorhodoferax sp.]
MNTNHIARIAALVGEPARAAMLIELMDGRALTAHELARAAHVAAPTASRHLAQLVEAGLLQVEPRGRHRYHRLASAEVARLLESIMQLAGQAPARPRVRVGPRDADLRQARLCYDHLAGRLGLAIAEGLLAERAIAFDGDSGHVTDRAGAVLQRWGLALDAQAQAPGSRRPYCRPCLDWSERQSHVAGRLGAMLCAHCLAQGWLLRKPDSRALTISGAGAARLRDLLGLQAWQRVAAPA